MKPALKIINMKVVEICILVVRFTKFKVQIEDEEADNVIKQHKNREDFVMKHLEENEPYDMDWLAMDLDKAFELGFATIKEIK